MILAKPESIFLKFVCAVNILILKHSNIQLFKQQKLILYKSEEISDLDIFVKYVCDNVYLNYYLFLVSCLTIYKIYRQLMILL